MRSGRGIGRLGSGWGRRASGFGKFNTNTDIFHHRGHGGHGGRHRVKREQVVCWVGFGLRRKLSLLR